jgi:23S rRNA (cytosine1962-C5)-methyltransferase
MKSIFAKLKPGRDKPVRHGHPWIFSGAVASWSSPPSPGDAVDVVAGDGDWLARGLASPRGNLAIRLYTRDQARTLDGSFFARRLAEAIAWRERIVVPQEPDTDSFRLCFSESDGLSGLIVDRYADRVSVQVNTSLLVPYLPAMTEALASRGLMPIVQFDRESFTREGAVHDLPAEQDELAQNARHPIRESGLVYHIDVAGGQKTGFYLDQRVNRRRVAAYAESRRCLSAYCYTGGFETHLARAGAASITGLDRSETAIIQARANLALNPGGTPVDHHVADVPERLRKYRDNRTDFDLIILDPPKFVHNQGQLEKGLRAYKDINRLAMKLLTPGGLLATFSCSGWVKREQFITTLEWAAQDAGRDVQILEQLGLPPDHPVWLSFPESDYLCGLIVRVA